MGHSALKHVSNVCAASPAHRPRLSHVFVYVVVAGEPRRRRRLRGGVHRREQDYNVAACGQRPERAGDCLAWPWLQGKALGDHMEAQEDPPQSCEEMVPRSRQRLEAGHNDPRARRVRARRGSKMVSDELGKVAIVVDKPRPRQRRLRCGARVTLRALGQPDRVPRPEPRGTPRFYIATPGPRGF